MKLNVALIGLGNISLHFDDNPNSKTILSHVKALYTNKNFQLKYCVDIDTSNQSKIQNLFPNILFYTDLTELNSKDDIDIIVIATPTPTHFEIFEKMKNCKNIKYFLIEKPLFDTNNHLESISKDFKNKIIINYIRVFEPNIQNFQTQIFNHQFGDPQKIILTYTKGIKNNGSHFISLINYLFNNPDIEDIQTLSSQTGLLDDPTLDVFASMLYKNKKIPLYLIGLNNDKYSLFDIDFYFERAKIRIEDTAQNMVIQKAYKDPIYKSYTTLNNKENNELDFDNIMKYPYEYIYNILNQEISPIDFIEHEKHNIQFYKSLEKKEFINE